MRTPLVFVLAALVGIVRPLIGSAATTLTPYDCWENLGFEETPPLNISHWSANGTAVAFIHDATQAHGGHGVLKVDGTSPVSVWGGRVAGTILPQPGQSVGGFFWLKLLSAPGTSAAIDVRMTGFLGDTETIYCHTEPIDLSTLALNTWTKVDLASAGTSFLAGSDVTFNIVSAGGVQCLIDDVTFGSLATVTDPELPPVATVDSAITPPFVDYVGSTFNGDFEVGNAVVGNQFWGQFVPNQAAVAGSPDMMTLVTTPAGIAPGAARSGANMVSISRGGIAWNIAALAASASDRLPRVGDLVGGAYWLYVPADADLSLGFPRVSFAYQVSGQGDVTVADTATFSAADLVKGAWNLVPIYPKAGAAVTGDATGFAILVNAPQLDPVVNPAYSSLYYIDRIRAGRIPARIFFASASRMVDAAGAPVAAPAPSDSGLRVETVVQNSSLSSTLEAYVALQLFQQDVLVRAAIKPVTIAAKGPLGLSNNPVSLSASLDGLDKIKLNVRLALFSDEALSIPLAAPCSLLQQTRDIAPSDPALRYFGRWTTEGSSRRGNWIRPYFKLSFSRSTSVAIHLSQATGLTVVLDGVRTDYSTVNGLVTLGANLSLSGTHTLVVSGRTWQDSIRFDGLRLDDTALLGQSPVRRDHIEFIGDSITAWDNGYSWLVPETLDTESSRIAWPGIALRDGFGYYTVPPGSTLTGMATAYFRNGMPGYGTEGAWAFDESSDAPDIVVVNLGTNDFAAIQGNTAQVAAFRDTYRAFIQNIRAKSPDARIFVLRPFTIHAEDVQTAIRDAAQAAIDAGDSRVHYVDTSAWGVAIGTDGIHPTDAGHLTITNRLATLLGPYLAGGVEPHAPGITSTAAATFTLGAASSFPITASGFPAPVLSAGDLPPWASLDPHTGVLAGTPAEAGVHTLTIRAENGVSPAATQTFTLAVAADFDRWAAHHFTAAQLADPEVGGPTATPFGDGVPNLLKHAFDIDPSEPITAVDRALLPRGGLKRLSGDTYLTLTFLDHAAATGMTRQLQSSRDLTTWQKQAPEIIDYASVDGDRVVEAGVKLDYTARRFLRLQFVR